MTAKRSVVLGCGSYLPQKVLTNAELAARIDTSDEWIVQRTGIRQRHIAADGEFTSHLAINAARAALDHAGIDAQSIDLIVLATSTPDNTFPATAVAVQNGLGINHGAAFDLQAVCSGFVFALATADNFLRSGAYKRALVIGAETFSRILDWNDRGTCVLFGDGAGAVVLEAQEQPGNAFRPRRADDASALRRPAQVEAVCRWRSVLDPDRRPSPDGRPRGVQARGRHDHRRDRRCLQRDRRDGRGHRLVHSASGQQANHRCFSAQASYCAAEGGADRRSARQHVGGLDSAGASVSRSRTDASRKAIWCCSKPWAVASPGVPRSCAGRRSVKYRLKL